MPNEQDDRIQGVDVEDLNDLLESLDYPITVDELIDRYGDREIDRTNAEPITLEALFDQAGEDRYESPDEVRQMVLTLMPRDSVGRAGYSDRGGSHPVETSDAEEMDQDESM